MNFWRIALLVLLPLTCVMQMVEGVASIANPASMMEGLGLSMAPGVEVPLTFLGLSMIVRGAIAAVALVWTIKGKREGLFLAKFVALTILLSAPVVYLKLRRVDFAAGDFIQGLLLLGPALMAKQQPQRGSL